MERGHFLTTIPEMGNLKTEMVFLIIACPNQRTFSIRQRMCRDLLKSDKDMKYIYSMLRLY